MRHLKREPDVNEPTFYEKKFKLKNFLDNTQYKNVKGNTLTGIIAFLYYSGSLFFFCRMYNILSFRHNIRSDFI